MCFSTQQHPFSWGIDVPARTLDVCLLTHAGALLGHRARQASPETFVQARAPSRAESVGAVAGLLTWSGLAARWAHAGWPVVRGPARSLTAIPGGTAPNDRLDARNIAGFLRGGLSPQTAVSPAALRATRARLRRRGPRPRPGAQRLPPLPQPHRQDHLPARGTKSAAQAHRAGVAERLRAPAVPHRVDVDLALRACDDP
jgi:hypothetical protein